MGSCMSSLSSSEGDVVANQWRKALKRSRKAKGGSGGRGMVKGRLFSRFGPASDAYNQQQSRRRRQSEEELHRMPGRLFLSGASEAACLFTQQGRKGTNQDAMLVWENFTSRDDTIFCGVFDGHGPYGHMVAKKVRDVLPLKLCSQWEAFTNSQNSHLQDDTQRGSSNSEAVYIGVDDESFEPIDISEGEKLPEIYSVLRKSLLRTFKLMDKELKLHETIDCFCSGCTAVTIIKQGKDLVIANVGDSRAVLATRAKDNSLSAVQLTVDLKPNLPKEAARIQQCMGRVFALQDEPEVARVWLPNNDSPGLAMSRAFGDFCLKDYGLISVPDVSYHLTTDRDEFVVLATDGVWDVLSNKEVVDVVASAPTRATAARALVDCAVRAWRLKFPTSKIDDCAVVCLYLNSSCLSDEEPQSSFGKASGELNEKYTRHMNGSGEGQPVNSELEHSDMACLETESLHEIKDDNIHERCQSTRRLADCISTAEDEEWSALEGVTRVNSLLNLPRFSGDEKLTN